MPNGGPSSRRSAPPKRVVEFRRPTGPALPAKGGAVSDHRVSSRHQVIGTLQLLAGLIVIVVNAKAGLFNNDDLVLAVGLLLAGSSIWWFGVFDRGTA